MEEHELGDQVNFINFPFFRTHFKQEQDKYVHMYTYLRDTGYPELYRCRHPLPPH